MWIALFTDKGILKDDKGNKVVTCMQEMEISSIYIDGSWDVPMSRIV